MFRIAQFSQEKACCFLSRAVKGNQELSNLFVLYTPTTSDRLEKTMTNNENSVHRYEGGSSRRAVRIQ